jgi:hypothetical protein
MSTPEDKDKRYGPGFLVGIGVGISLTGAFNPFDRALYLMILHNRPFLSRQNFIKPWEGFSQAVVVRTFSGGMFYPVFDVWLDITSRAFANGGVDCSTPQLGSVLAGQLTGVTNAVLVNPMNAIKYHMWSKDGHPARCTIQDMWHKHGLAAFAIGMRVTVMRDAVFGGVYAGSREVLQKSERIGPHSNFVMNLCAASLATGLASPWNYARNMQFASLSDSGCYCQPTVRMALRELWDEVRRRHRQQSCRKAADHLQSRLGLSWGTLRVGLGMSLGQQMYDFLKKLSQ